MKLAGLFLGLILIGAAACTNFLPVDETPVFTPLPPTMTPDPCGPESVSDTIEEIRESLNKFQEIAFIAANTPVDSLILPVMRMEEIRITLDSLPVPDCVQDLKSSCSDYTASQIRYFSKLMNNVKVRDAAVDLQNSQTLWMIVEREYDKLISQARLVYQPLTSSDTVLPMEIGFGTIAINEGEKSTNIREEPDLEADIVSTLDPGVSAMVIGRTKNGDWILVNAQGVFGWIFTEMIELNVDLDQIDVVNPIQ